MTYSEHVTLGTVHTQRTLDLPLSSPSPYPHWMLREIHEQPATLAATLDRYVANRTFSPEFAPVQKWLAAIGDRIIIAASGSSRHAGLVAETTIENFSSVAVDVEYASEFSYNSSRSGGRAGVIVVSQSGETADTLAALRKANTEGHPTLSIINVDDSSMAQEATVSFPTFAGRERAIPATKSFTAQLLNLHLLTLMCGVIHGSLSADELACHLDELASLPGIIERQLRGWETSMNEIARRFGDARSFLFLGRSLHYPIAREGALKLKESAYLHAEGYPSGELKHGPNALVAEGTPLAMLCTVDRADASSVERYDKVVKLVRDMRRQGAEILAIATTGDETVESLATRTVFVDPVSEPLLAICEVIPLQMLAYFMAVHHDINVDSPRNLTKAVLAE